MLEFVIAIMLVSADGTGVRDQAMDAYMTCLARHARAVDDGKSDASTIAVALQGACPKEEAQLKDAYSGPSDREARQAFEKLFENGRRAMATRAVLFERRNSN